MGKRLDGILLVDKEEMETSFGAVRKVRSLLRDGRPPKVGHAGTLDPFATGLLLVLIGQGTKLFPYLMPGRKAYLATLRLGVETDTLDPTGSVVATKPVPALSRQRVEAGAESFLGRIEQVPPAYSAVKQEGKPAYKLARAGIEVRLRKRQVTIHSLRILTVTPPEFTAEIVCSSGTYVRRLASDLSRKLGTVGHLKTLRRLASGAFDVNDAVHSSKLTGAGGKRLVADNLISLRKALKEMPEIRVNKSLAGKFRQGLLPSWEELRRLIPVLPDRDKHVMVVSGEELVAIAEVDNGEDNGVRRVTVERVFS